MSRRRKRSLGALEVQRRQIREDATLGEEVRRNLLTRSLGLDRLGLSQDEEDVGIGLIEARRALLATIPTLRGVERVHAVIRLQEQIHKATSALRRRGHQGRSLVKRVPTQRSPVPTAGARCQVDDEVEDDDHDSDEPAEEGLDGRTSPA